MKFKHLNITLGLFVLLLIPTLALAHGISEEDKAAMLSGGYLQYLWLGASHMLTGYDHLLFIFGVIFFLTGFKDIVKYITIFTLGHSLTLVFATILGITANYFLVDAVIALSVCYKGFDNLDGFKKYLKMPSPNLLWVIFIFGLIHGFGLSTRLQQLPLGETGLIMRILSFNVGVELGQITALTVMLVLIAGWRRTKSFAQFSTLSNAGLIAAGAFLFLMQMHGYTHTSDPDEFGFSTDNHHHEHLRMEEEVLEQQKKQHDSIF
ncbi:putative membrane protein [hydrothermal vent metagenome]|uniref:Putative membrane protein n=1 Tax=hydrothermal vent metagenome TaxID=652676 RepID=A0A3B1D6H8_9ZZZZ